MSVLSDEKLVRISIDAMAKVFPEAKTGLEEALADLAADDTETIAMVAALRAVAEAAIESDRAARADNAHADRMERGVLQLAEAAVYTATPAAPVVPDGWVITRCDDGEIVITHNEIGGVVVNRNPRYAREIPESILWALADAMLSAAPAPSQEPKQ